MSGHTRPKLLALICFLAAALTASRVGAETPAGQSTSSSPAPAAAAKTGCLTPGTAAIAGGASIVQVTGESLQHKNWQPAGGEIQFTVQSSVAIPPDAEVFVCFRWKSPESKFIGTRPSQLDLADEKKQLKITTTVPDLGPPPAGVARALWLVPLAEVRILAIHDKETPADVTKHNKETLADVTTAIGIPYLSLAIIFAIATVALGFVVMHIAVGRRLKHPGILQANWLLRIISTPSGFASLSQLQILLWTFVVAASAVYVMSLSGHLIEITSTTLVLLGIAGAAGIGAAAHFEAQGATAEAAATKAAADSAAAEIIAAEKAAAAAAAPPDPVAAARLTAEHKSAERERAAKAKIAKATRARADALKNPPAAQSPKWSDLIFNESVKDDGTVTREIDVARYQMLLFTLVTAVFVLMNVVTSYVIPDIPAGFVTLMGISNGVYMGSKIAQSS
jgi:hypothetical protein